MTKQSNRPFWFLFGGDFHSGHALGLLHPKSKKESFGKKGESILVPVVLNKAQEYLYELLTWARTSLMGEINGEDTFLTLMGDYTQGNKYGDHLLTSDIDFQVQWAFDLITDFLPAKNIKGIRLVSSTPSHAFNNRQADVILATKLRSKKRNTRLVGHGLIEVNGVLLDLAHHGSMGGIREWTKDNMARYYLRSVFYTALRQGQIPPMIVARAHAHVPIDVQESHFNTPFNDDGPFRQLAIHTPSFQFLTDYARQRTKSVGDVTNGLVGVRIQGGTIDRVVWRTKTLDLRENERLNYA